MISTTWSVCSLGKYKVELIELDRRIAFYDRQVRELYRNSELCQRLGKIEGIRPVTATALIAAVGDRTCFKNGRQFAAWLGLVPKQRSSGGRTQLFGISKRGDRYLRTLMIHGVRAALGKAGGNKIHEVAGSATYANGAIRMWRRLHSLTRMRASSGPCSPATNFTNPNYRYKRPKAKR